MNTEGQKKLIDNVAKGKVKTLRMDDEFKFECTGCGKCCFNNDIILNSYDLIRLRHSLKLPTHEILQRGILEFYIGPNSGLPVITFKFKSVSDDGSITCCPFLVPALNIDKVMDRLKSVAGKDANKFDKLVAKYKADPNSLKEDLRGIEVDKWLCRVHDDRPIICRLFPCGRIQSINTKNNKVEEKFILQDSKEDRKYCPGFKTNKKTTLKAFLDSQKLWHSRDGSAKFTDIVNLLTESGFFASTKTNQNSSPSPKFKEDSPIMSFLGNLLYNFDSFNTFSKDPRVMLTIIDGKASQKDFLYVMDKIYKVVKEFVEVMSKKNPGDDDFKKFITSLETQGRSVT